ncbi:uncharacterized protein K02A2.6-like [Sipha flava]|uniref:Uncharacterized protein K02A2.6-like n=1 Tax=Sipha flava TaxID=143950 RepID=A0A8B8GCA8_9HEMI|nr:uncharacterized protein K02A2.6-like [Sipha flava]
MSEEEQVLAMQRTDAALKHIVEILSREDLSRTQSEAELVKDYCLEKGLLYRRVTVDGNIRKLWAVPNSMRKSIVVPRERQPGELNPIEPGKRPFETVNLDHVGPFVKSTKGNRYILVLIDNLTKFVKLYPVRSCGTEGMTNSLRQFILTYGSPKRVISDRGTAFTSRAFGNFCSQHGIKPILNSVRHPQSNGQVERVNSTLIPVLQANMECDNKWDKLLLEAE